MPSSSSTTTEATLWIRLEDKLEPFKFLLKDTNNPPDLDALASHICQRARLQQLNVDPENVQFFGNYNRNYYRKIEAEAEEEEGESENGSKPLRRAVLLKDLEATDASPLVVRYPLSATPVVIRCNLSTSWFKEDFPHTTGLWHHLRDVAEKRFETLQPAHTQYFFVYNRPGATPGDVVQIRNAYQLNGRVGGIQLNDRGEREISLSIRVAGRKAYGDWEIAEVLKVFLEKDGRTYLDIAKFNMNDLPTPNPALNDGDFAHLIGDLGKKKQTIVNVNRNEATCREFISSFMIAAVAHVKAEDERLQLKIEEWLDGPRGYGPLDYSVDVDGAVVLVHEAKKEDFEKGAAQNIVQMHSAVETLRTKRKLLPEDDNDSTVPVLVYGVVTNALQWIFLRWGGSSDKPTIEVSPLYYCGLDQDIGDGRQVQQIIGYLITILQSQVRGLKEPEKRVHIKRRRS